MVNTAEAFKAIAAVSLFVQSYLSTRIAFLRASRDAINFEYLALAAAPDTALWVTQHGRFGALHIPQPVARHWLVPREPADTWLQAWVEAATHASRDRRRREGVILVISTGVVLSAFLFTTWMYSQRFILAVRETFFTMAVDAALITLDPCPLSASILQLAAKFLMVCPSLEVVLSHSIIAILVGLRLGKLAVADLTYHKMPTLVRYRALQRLVTAQKRKPHHRFIRYATIRRMLGTLIVATLPGIQAVYDALRRLSAADTCKCDFDSVDQMFKYELCTPNADGVPWCFVNRHPSSWGFCGSHPIGFNASEWPDYSGENLCPLLGGAAANGRFWMELWCLAPWQHKVAAALLPGAILGLFLYAIVRQLRRSGFRLTLGLSVNVLVVYALAIVLIWVWPELDCYKHKWSPAWLRLIRLTTTILGMICAAAFYSIWRSQHFAKPSLPIVVLWLSSIVFMLLGSPVAKYGNFADGVSSEDLVEVCTIAIVIECNCAFIAWRSYFSSNFRFPPLGWASLGFGLAIHTFFAVFLLVCFPSQGTMTFAGYTVKESTLNFAIMVTGAPFLFLLALKGRQYVKCIAARDGCEESEKQQYDELRRRCAWQLIGLFVPIGILACPVALTANAFVFNFVAWLALAHLSVGLFHYEYLYSPLPYPVGLRIAWAVLYILCLACAVLLGVKRSIRSGLLAAGVATEFHLLLMALGSQKRASHVHVRLLHGWFSHGLRSIFYCYDAGHDQLRFLWRPCAAALASVFAGCVWSLGAIDFWINVEVCIGILLIRFNVLGLWKLRCAQVCDIPCSAAGAKTTWVLEEGVRVWDCVHPEPESDLLKRFHSLLEHSAQFAFQLETEVAADSKNKQESIAVEKDNIVQAVKCGLLEWEFRFAVRLEAEMERMSSMLLGAASSMSLQALNIEDVLDLPDDAWEELLMQVSSQDTRVKRDRKVERQVEEQRDAARRERDRIREQSERRRSSIEPSVEIGRENISGDEFQKSRSWWAGELRNHEQRGQGSFFDADFPASVRSLGSVAPRMPSVSWVRFPVLYAGNRLILRGRKFLGQLASRGPSGMNQEGPSSLAGEELAGDIAQGSLGDCWLLSAMAVLCTRPQLLERLFLDSPNVNASGAYCFQLFQRGRTRRVIVDDFIPVSPNGHTVQPVFARPQFGGEGSLVMWPLLLEKAFAKLYGSYGAIEAGLVHEALMDLTGGLGEMIMFGGRSGVPANLWARLCQCKKAGHLLAAGSRAGSDSHTSPRGIVQGHAYSILSVRDVGGLRLLKLRNPWGRCEWTGDFSDNSRTWTPELKAALRWTAADDGMFWMQFSDFLCEFECVFICRVFPSAQFERQALSGQWARGSQETFLLTVRSSGAVCMQLEQADARGTGQSQSSAIRLEVRPRRERPQPDGGAPFGISPFQHFAPVDNRCISSTPLTMGREVALEVNLNEGQHEIVAILQSQSMSVKMQEFTLTVFSNRQMNVQLVTQTPAQPSAQPRERASQRESTHPGRHPAPYAPHPPHWPAHWGVTDVGHANSLERSVEMARRSDFGPSPQMSRNSTNFNFRPMYNPGPAGEMMHAASHPVQQQRATANATDFNYRHMPNPGSPLQWQPPTPLSNHLDRAIDLAAKSDFGIDRRRPGISDKGLYQPFVP